MDIQDERDIGQRNFFEGHNELNTGGGECRVAENNTRADNNTRRRITQGGE